MEQTNCFCKWIFYRPKNLKDTSCFVFINLVFGIFLCTNNFILQHHLSTYFQYSFFFLVFFSWPLLWWFEFRFVSSSFSFSRYFTFYAERGSRRKCVTISFLFQLLLFFSLHFFLFLYFFLILFIVISYCFLILL